MHDSVPVYHIPVVFGVGPGGLEHSVVVEVTVVQFVELPIWQNSKGTDEAPHFVVFGRPVAKLLVFLNLVGGGLYLGNFASVQLLFTVSGQFLMFELKSVCNLEHNAGD